MKQDIYKWKIERGYTVPYFQHECDFNFDSKSSIEQCSVCRKYWVKTSTDVAPTEWRLRNRRDRRDEHKQRSVYFRNARKADDARIAKWATRDQLQRVRRFNRYAKVIEASTKLTYEQKQVIILDARRGFKIDDTD